MLSENLNNRYLDFISRDFHDAMQMGLKTFETELGDPSLAYADETIQIADQLKTDFQEALANAADFDQKLDCELAILHIEQTCEQLSRECDGVRDFCRLPDAGSQIGNALFKLMAQDPRPDAERLQVIVLRLPQTGVYLEQMLKRTNMPLARWVAIELEQLQGLTGIFESIIGWAKATGFADIESLIKGVEHSNQAITKYQQQLQQLPQSEQLFLGEQALEKILLTKAIPFSPTQLHEISRNFLASVSAEIDQLGKKLQQKYSATAGMNAAQIHQYLVNQYPVDPGKNYQGILNAYLTEHHKLEKFVQQTGLFPLPENQQITIIQTPPFLEATIPAGAMSPPAPFEEGIKSSLVFLTLNPELLAEHTHVGVPTMMLHEGIPGHHLQLAMAAMNASKIRASFNANEHAEGWTTYLEDYVLDQGYCGDFTLEVRFLAKREICRLAARIAIDLFFVSGNKDYLDIGIELKGTTNDPFALAGELLQTVTGFTPGRVKGEINWYSTERGYPLSYLTGNHMTWALKHKMQSKCSAMSDKELDILFHKTYLESGNMPLSYLEKVFREKGFID